MRKFTRAALAAAATLIASTGAFAADLYGGSIKDNSTPVMTSRPALFYVRGDYTFSSNDFGSLTELPNYTFSNTSVSHSHAWGGGIGYHFSSSVRGDLTLDWGSAATVSGSVNNSLGNGQGQFGVRRLVGLANLYYDFDVGSRFKPYLGVGLGFARTTTTSGDGTATCTTAVCGGSPATATITTEGASKTNAAGALMAGFSAKLHDRWNLDAGYRFLYVGNARTGDAAVVYTPAAPTAPATIPGFSVNDLYAHEFRVGLRMDIR